MLISRRSLLISTASAALAPDSGYETLELEDGDGRVTHYRIAFPTKPGRWGVVLFSHGANSANTSYDRLWRIWAARGYVVIGPNHIDSGPTDLQAKVDRAALWRSRLDDTRLPLGRRDVFEAKARARGGALDWGATCGAGHSFGAVVAQALAGAWLIAPGDVQARSLPPLVSACIALSPPGPLKGFVPTDAWRGVTAPSFLQTGDADVLPGFVDDWRERLQGFAGSPNRWILVGHGVDHYFGGLICRLKPDAGARQAALDETANLTADFLDAFLRHDRSARKSLQARAARGDDGVAIFNAA